MHNFHREDKTININQLKMGFLENCLSNLHNNVNQAEN